MTARLSRRVMLLFIPVLFSFHQGSGQSAFFKNNKFDWNDLKKVNLNEDISEFSNYDLVILDEVTEFRFHKFSRSVTRLLTIKINSEKGGKQASEFKLPESFDLAYDAHRFKQGRESRIKTPFISEYSLIKFSARKLVGGSWKQLHFNDRYEEIKWISGSGEFINDELTQFKIQDVNAGDVIQIYYEADFRGLYGSGQFYFYGANPKIRSEYNFSYEVDKIYSGHMFVAPMNLNDSAIKYKDEIKGDMVISNCNVVLRNLEAVNYPSNAFPGNTLPHLYVDMGFLPIIANSYPDGTSRHYEYVYVKPKKFEWVINNDTSLFYTRIYNKYYASLRKFVSTLPPVHPDSNNINFFRSLCDTVNSFRYLTMNHLYYNESNLYEISTIDHVLRRRLAGSSHKLCRDILNDNSIFYYLATIQDKRLGEHSPFFRVHPSYESTLISIPNKNNYLYFLSRPRGLIYHLNELPFYLEGSLAALLPMNLQEKDTAKLQKFYKFIKTHKGAFNENTRTENATVKIDLDKQEGKYAGKESLSGQFSTILRHLYLNELIDSTLSPHYFKKCTDKPRTALSRISLSSKISDFPFRYTFNCSENLTLAEKNKISLSNWFSFTLNRQFFPEKPNHNFYFDFEFTDAYNFLLDFSVPKKIRNAHVFDKNINNEYFELESGIIRQSETSYLVKVRLAVKKNKIPVANMQLLMDVITHLEELNSFTIEIEDP
jgi:hypothetical protein